MSTCMLATEVWNSFVVSSKRTKHSLAGLSDGVVRNPAMLSGGNGAPSRRPRVMLRTTEWWEGGGHLWLITHYVKRIVVARNQSSHRSCCLLGVRSLCLCRLSWYFGATPPLPPSETRFSVLSGIVRPQWTQKTSLRSRSTEVAFAYRPTAGTLHPILSPSLLTGAQMESGYFRGPLRSFRVGNRPLPPSVLLFFFWA